MLEVIEKLLVLQDRDRKILRVKAEMMRIGPERLMLETKAAQAQGLLEAAKNQVKHIESERKKLELDAEAKQQLIAKYSLQQFQTKKNEEYRALAHEIEMCKEAISKLDDQQIELMEQGEAAQKAASIAQVESAEIKRVTDAQLADLAKREQNLKKELAELESNRDTLTSNIEESTLARYERLLKQKGENVVVGINHGVCGGCHMKFPVQLVVTCQAQQQLVTCPNCGRMLYYSREMDLTPAD